MGKQAFFALMATGALLLPVSAQSAQQTSARPAPAKPEVSAPAVSAQPATPERGPINPDAAFAVFSAKAEKGDPAAMLALGGLYEQGVGTPRNFIKAREWYEKAAAAGSPEAMYNAGICYEIGMGTSGDIKRAVQFYQQAADKGVSQGMYKMASLYATGNGVERNDAKTFEFLEKAAKSGHMGAAMEVGMVFLRGDLDQAKNEARALEMFTIAADKGNLEALKNVAVMYKDGIGTKPDPQKALKWYIVAKKGGYQAPDMDAVIDGLKKSMQPAQAKQAEAEADKWVEDFKKRSG